MSESWRSGQAEDEWRRAFADDAAERRKWEPSPPSIHALIAVAALIIALGIALLLI
jgi:hypothetical protein